MEGMNSLTGRLLGGADHLRQSMRDILTTPVGSRVMRRDYGSRVPDLIDQPANHVSLQRLYAAIADALIRWEPRLRVHRIQIHGGEPAAGRFELDIEGEYLPDGLGDRAERVRLQGIAL